MSSPSSDRGLTRSQDRMNTIPNQPLQPPPVTQQTVGQPINTNMNQSMNQSHNQQIHPSNMNQTMNQQVHQQHTINQSMNQPLQSQNQPMNPSLNQQMNQPMHQFASYPIPANIMQAQQHKQQDMIQSNNHQSMNQLQQGYVSVIGHSPFSPFTIIKQQGMNQPEQYYMNQTVKPTPSQSNNIIFNQFHQGTLCNVSSSSSSPQAINQSINQPMNQSVNGMNQASYPLNQLGQFMPMMLPQYQTSSVAPLTQSVSSTHSMSTNHLNAPRIAQPQPALPVHSPSPERQQAHHNTTKHESRRSHSNKEKDHSDQTTREAASISDIAVALAAVMHDDTDGSDKPRSDWNQLEKTADGPLSDLLKVFMERHEQPATIDQNQSMMDVHSVKTLLAYVFNALSDHDSELLGCIHCHEKKGSRWTDSDDRAMIDLLSQGHDFNEIAKKLKRTIRALKDRYCYLKKSHMLDVKAPSQSSSMHFDNDQESLSAVPALPVNETTGRRRKPAKRKRKYPSADPSDSESDGSSARKIRSSGLDTLASTASTSSSDGSIPPRSPSAESDGGSSQQSETSSSSSNAMPGWSVTEEEQVLTMLKSGASLREAAALSGRSIAAIKGKMQRNKSKARATEALLTT